MLILCADDEPHALNNLCEAVSEALDSMGKTAEIHSFDSAEDAIEFAREKPCSIAFLDVRMPKMSGLEMAKRLKEINPKTNIIFVTGYSDYLGDAFEMHASGYIQKPVSPDEVVHELTDLRIPIAVPQKKLLVQTFGNFEVFIDGEIVKFTRAKSKELFAYLVDRKGASITYKQCRAILWEDEPDSLSLKNKFKTCVSELKKTFKAYGITDIIKKNGQGLSVSADNLVCDYYEYQKGNIAAVNQFAGEYMLQYSWAEFTLGNIVRREREKKR